MPKSELPPSPLAPGHLLLSRYRVIDQLAHGGHSRVYRLEDERLGRPACAKVLTVSDVDERIRAAVGKRFVYEASVLARLGNPAVIQIYDLGHLPASSPGGPDIPFHILELISGGSLSRSVRRNGRLPPSEVLDVILPICRALADVHALGLVHMDIKPQNILLGESETGRHPKLADFGIAQTMRSALADQPSAVLMYSMSWAAPEQLVGDEVDASSDVYALALVTIYALTGRVVFRSSSDSTQAYRIRKHSEEVIRGALSAAGLSEELIALFQRACSFFPSDRFASAMDFGRQLVAMLSPMADEVVVAAPGQGQGQGQGQGDDYSVPTDAGDRPASQGPSVTMHRTAASLWPLSPRKPSPDVGGRSLTFVMVDAAADLVLKSGARIRVSLMPSSVERGRLHLQGLNCFVALAGGRPSSALTLDSNGAVDFVSPRGDAPLARAQVLFATAGPSKTTLTIDKNIITIPTAECAWLVGLDFGPEQECILLYDMNFAAPVAP